MEDSMENGVILDLNRQPLIWHMPKGSTEVRIPDSRRHWEDLWENKHQISGTAHSHPGCGEPHPSWEDVTTFAAIEMGLGKRLEWWITSKDVVILATWVGPGKYDYQVRKPEECGIETNVYRNWVTILRNISYGGFEVLVSK